MQIGMRGVLAALMLGAIAGAATKGRTSAATIAPRRCVK